MKGKIEEDTAIRLPWRKLHHVTCSWPVDAEAENSVCTWSLFRSPSMSYLTTSPLSPLSLLSFFLSLHHIHLLTTFYYFSLFIHVSVILPSLSFFFLSHSFFHFSFSSFLFLLLLFSLLFILFFFPCSVLSSFLTFFLFPSFDVVVSYSLIYCHSFLFLFFFLPSCFFPVLSSLVLFFICFCMSFLSFFSFFNFSLHLYILI